MQMTIHIPFKYYSRIKELLENDQEHMKNPFHGFLPTTSY